MVLSSGAATVSSATDEIKNKNVQHQNNFYVCLHHNISAHNQNTTQHTQQAITNLRRSTW